MPEFLGHVHFLNLNDVIDIDKFPEFLDLVYGREQWAYLITGQCIEVRSKPENPKDLGKALRDIGCMKYENSPPKKDNQATKS
ncbi:hypothetical protein FALBO_15528 [Fusarium albosuccineum]|uniref:Uncharacterized protein n=1 Tax=Fusarium albosuccineum TaxID=1237068 RepID=A0A8H4KUD6_9HYPO|nr:hypothetical protein FALBO_15528 [Fusarium albosuccineum]